VVLLNPLPDPLVRFGADDQLDGPRRRIFLPHVRQIVGNLVAHPVHDVGERAKQLVVDLLGRLLDRCAVLWVGPVPDPVVRRVGTT
jgi:hypothetical protein